MVKVYVISFMDGSEQEIEAGINQVIKRPTGIEVLNRNEELLEYQVTFYPWHSIKELNTFGKLERKTNHVRS